MRTKNFLKHLIIGATFLTAGNVVGQSTTPGNVANLNTDFLGWNTNAANNFPLVVKHELNQPIQFLTDGILRMRLLGTNTTQLIGSYINQDVSGNLGVGLFNTANVTTPWSLLHLDNGGNQFSGYRPWLRPGMTITSGTDMGWIGLKNEGGDLNHFTLAWADNTLMQGPDLFKMIFLANPGTTGTAGTLNGLEAFRIRPSNNGMEAFVGIGDWFTTGGNINPRERLDLLDGRLRIRRLPDSPETNQAFKVMVVDDSNDPNERGVVKWRALDLNGGCDWVVQDQVSSNPPHVSNTYDNSNCAWDRRHGVGIGVDVPKSKLFVYHWDNTLLSPTAITADARFDLGNAGQLFGLFSQARPTSSVMNVQNQQAIGVFGQGLSSRTSVGVHGLGSNCTTTEGNASSVIGVKGEAGGCERAAFVAGLYGEGSGSLNGTNHWAAYINGRGFIAQGPWQPSDEQLKMNIQPYGNSAAVNEQAVLLSSNPVLSLPVHSYMFNTAAFPSLQLPVDEQVGFLASELEELLPSAVTHVVHPEELDSLGNVISAPIEFKAINPLALIPYLVDAVQMQRTQFVTLQEQQSRTRTELDELRAQLSDLQQALAACCAATPGDTRLLTTPPANTPDDLNKALEGDARHLHIQPNPFTERTTLHYRLERAGRMQLLANSADGKALKVLQEATLEAGAYQYNWETNELTPGVYYVTLLLDGEPLVKKAVKVMR